MKTKLLILTGFAIMALSLGTAQAGPCDTTGRAADKDAGSGPTAGSAGQTTGMSTEANQHPPTSTMTSIDLATLCKTSVVRSLPKQTRKTCRLTRPTVCERKRLSSST